MATFIKKTMRDGSTRWQARVVRRGRVMKKTTATKAAAEKWARARETAIDDGRAVPTAEDRRRTVAEALDAYELSGALTSLGSAHLRRQHLSWWKGRLGNLRLRDLSREDVRKGLAALEAGDGTPSERPVTGSTRRRYIASLRPFLGWCVDQYWIQSNPAAGAARKGIDTESPGRTRYLTDKERTRLLKAVANHAQLAAITRLALLTGMRQGELLGLEWPHLDLDRGVASLERTKGGVARSVALSAPAVELLRELRSERVLGWYRVFAVPPFGRARFPRAAWNDAVAAAKLEDFRFHDLRHTYAAALLSSGATLPELAAALGHRTLVMVQRYAHLEKPHAASLAERVAERLSH